MQHQAQCNLLALAFDGVGDNNCPYYNAFYACTGVSVLTFVVSTVTRNYSQVDKLWSITPILYAWMAVVDQRTLLMAVLATIWGVRLTANFHRRGGYQWPPWRGEEDYRWSYIQQGHYIDLLKHQIPWMIFNLLFISIYQNFLLLLTTAPSFVAWTLATNPSCSSNYAPLNMLGLDGLATIFVLTFIAIETISDNQQYAFQTEKYRQINAGIQRKGDFADGFCQSGLYAVVRKPNYAAEQSIWISYYIFSIAATIDRTLLNWSAIGCFLLVLLFQGSGRFTEKLTLAKYPVKYQSYQKKVPLYVPKLFGSMSKKED